MSAHPSFSQALNTALPAKPKKRVWKGMSDIELFSKLMFGGGKGLPNSWGQGWLLSEHEGTPFGLLQVEGGPCGLIAAVQCYYLKHLYFNGSGKATSRAEKEKALMAAIAELLVRASSNNEVAIIKKRAPSKETARL
jgi:hypothetical protein